MAGRLVSVEGISGVGKTTLTEQLADVLGRQGQRVVSLEGFAQRAEQAGHDLGSDLLRALIDAASGDPFLRGGHPATETLLLLAIKTYDYEEHCVPALRDGCVVIEGRSLHTTAVYQSLILHPGEDRRAVTEARAILKLAAHFRPLPDLTLLLADDVTACIERLEQRDRRPCPPQQRDLHQRADRLFAQLAHADPTRVRVIDRRRADRDTVVRGEPFGQAWGGWPDEPQARKPGFLGHLPQRGLGRGPSILYAQLDRLEHCCGGPLIHRNPRPPGAGTLTPLGQQLREQARDYLGLQPGRDSRPCGRPQPGEPPPAPAQIVTRATHDERDRRGVPPRDMAIQHGAGSARLPVAVEDRGAQYRCWHAERRQDRRHQPFADGEEAKGEMLDTDLGVVPGLRLTAGVPQALLDARCVREENPIPLSAGATAGVQPGHARPAVDCPAGLREGSRPEGRLDPGAHGVKIDPDGG